MIIHNCEQRIGRTFSIEDLENGELKKHLSDEDYALPSNVSNIHLPRYI